MPTRPSDAVTPTYEVPSVPDLIMPGVAPGGLDRELAPVTDDALHALAARVSALHEDFARQEFVFRVRVGQEVVQTLYGGRFERYHASQSNKEGSFNRFLALHGADLEARGLGGAMLRRCIRAAEVTPDPTMLPEFVTFSHVLAIAALPEAERSAWLARLALKPMSVRELQAQLQRGAAPDAGVVPPGPTPASGAGPASDPPDPRPKGHPGHVPRRLQSVADALRDIPLDLASEVKDRPEVAADAVQKLLAMREHIDGWLAELGMGVQRA